MNRQRGSLSTRLPTGWLVCVLAFLVFQAFLTLLTHVAQREFFAENLDAPLGAYLAPAFLHARIWLGIVLVLLLLTLKYFDFGPPAAASLTYITLFVVLAYLLVVIRALQYPVCIDDAYIDFRQAWNLGSHGSLDYNPGDPVMGFTSHLHLWILTAMGRLVGYEALPLWSQNFNILCDLGSFGLVYKLGRQLKLAPLSALVGSGLLVLLAYQTLSTTDGKESSVQILLLLILIFAFEIKRLGVAAWAASLIFLTRPEGILVVVAVGLWGLRTHGLRSLKYWMGPGLLAGIWYALLLFHFGTIWPQGMVAKTVIYPHPAPLNVAAGILLFLWESFGCTGGNYFWLGTFPGVFSTILLLALVGWALGHSAGIRFYLVLLLLLSLAFVVKQVEMGPFPWYFAWYALVPILVLPVVFERVTAWAQRFRYFRRLLAASALGLVVFIPLNTYRRSQATFLGLHSPDPFFTWDDTRQRLLAYGDLARRIKAESGGSAKVATCEDGMFGFIYGGPILTLDGLAFRDIQSYYPLPDKFLAINYAIAPQLVLDQQPDYVVFLEVFGRNSLLKDENFLKRYTLEETLPATAFQSRGMLLYKKKPVSVADPVPAKG